MRFKFSLETVLRLRRLEQQEAQRSLNEALSAVEILTQRMEQIQQERAASRQYIAPGIGDVRVNLLLDGGRYDLQLQARIYEFEQQRSQLNIEAERRREVLRKADQQVRQLERLRESALHRFEHEAQAKQQKELDEIAVQLHQRNQPN